jgi:serine/threonine protein kinase
MMAEHKETKEKVALKLVDMEQIFAINKERHIYRERDLLFKFKNSHHIIELKETFIVVSTIHSL